MNSLPYEGVLVLVIGTGPRVGRARQLLAEGGANLTNRFSSAVTYVVIDRTVSPNASQVVAARRAAIPVVSTSELQQWPGMESLAAVSYPPAPRAPVVGPVAPVPTPYYASPLPVQRDSSNVDATLAALGWVGMPLVTGGVAMPFIAGYVAGKLRSSNQAMVAGGYAGLLTVAFVGIALSPGTAVIMASVFVWLCCWLGGSVHAYLLHEMVSRADKTTADDDNLMVSDPRNAHALAAIERKRTLRAEARALAKRDPVAARELGIGRPDRPGGYDDGGLVDVNNAPESTLRQLPGVTDEVATEIVRRRETIGQFESTSDVVVHTNIEPRFVDRLDELALYVT